MRWVAAFLRRHLLIILGALVLLTVVVVLWIFSVSIAQWLRSAQSADAVAFLQEHLLVVAIVGSCLLILALIWLPKWQASPVQDVKDRLTVENAARQSLAQIVGGAVLIAGLFFTWANLKITQESATKNQEIAHEGQITDRFTKAIAQLGEQGPEKLAVRLGGIYALERIARDSAQDHWAIMEVLTAYVRENAPWPPKDAPVQRGRQLPVKTLPPKNILRLPRPPADIQAITTVLGRRIWAFEGKNQVLNLMNTDLQLTDLEGIHLKGARLWGTRLEGANLKDAQLAGAILTHAHLGWANLWGAHFEEAHFNGAHLGGGIFLGTYLQGAHDLTVEQLCTAYTLYEAQLDPPLMEQIRQQCPKRLEPPYE